MTPRRATRAVALAALAFPSVARAYQAESAVTSACHERISTRALAAVRASSDRAPAVPTTDDERALLRDLPTSVTDADLAEGALVIGVREPDFRDLDPTSSTRLAHVHADPASQREHCLRAPGDDEPDGTRRALEACRAFIRERVAQALDGLDATGAVDPSSRDPVAVHLDFRGRVSAPLPRFWVRAGQALHALQDGFSHSYRTADQRRVTVALNYVDTLDDADPARDGPSHKRALDECDDVDALRAARLSLAQQASFELLDAALGPGSRDERLARVDAVLDAHLSYEPGCTAANRWCDAPEERYEDPSCGCAIVGAKGHRAALACVAAGAAWLLLRRRRARVVVALVAIGGAARADDEGRVGAYAAGGGAVDQGAFNASIAGRLRASPRWLAGLDAEWNPWWSVDTRRVRPGTLNVYATGIRRYDTRDPDWKLRTTLHVGTSTLLFDLYEAPKGTTGPYFGVNFLGLEIDLGRRWVLVIDPADVAITVPQVRGTPLVYRQYRFTVGLQWGI